MELRDVSFRVGALLVEPALNRVSRGDAVVKLEPRTMDVLVYFASRPGELVTKTDLIDDVWRVEAVSTSSLTRAVADLRRALGDDVGNPRFVETIPKRGYRLVAEVVVEPTETLFLDGAEIDEIERPVLVARGSELAQLNGFLARTLDGDGGLAMVSGEAGTGKTALLTEFARRATGAHDELLVVPAHCSAHTGPGDPFAPFRRVLRLLTGDVETAYRSGQISREQADRLWSTAPGAIERIATSDHDLVETLLLGADLVERAKAAVPEVPWLIDLERLAKKKSSLPGDPMLQQPALIGQCIGVVQAVASARPVLMILDDLHWADTGSVGLLFELARELGGSQLLIVGAFRPEDVEIGRGGERHPLAPILNELTRIFGDVTIHLRHAGDREFVEAFLDSEPNTLDGAFRDELYRRTEGHALFTVELMRSLQERGLVVPDDSGRWTMSGDLDWQTVPDRMDAVIGERIERLGDRLRELLTVASVEGTDFTAEVLARVRDDDTRRVVRLLSGELERRHRLVSARGSLELVDNTLDRFGFAHILFQRYVYNDLGEVERRDLHFEVGEILEALYGDDAPRIATQLARHFDEAGVSNRAIHHYRTAADRAVRMTANVEAIALFERALELIRSLPGSADRDRLEVVTLLALQAPLIGSQGWSSDQARSTSRRALALAEDVDDDALLLPVYFHMAIVNGGRAEYREALALAARALDLARANGDDGVLAFTHVANAFIRETMGALESTLGHLDKAIALIDPARHEMLRYHYGGVDPEVAARCRRGWVLAVLGYLDQGLESMNEGMEVAARIEHPFSQTFASWFMTWLRQLRGELEAGRDQNEDTIRLASAHSFPVQLLWSLIHKRTFDLESGTADGSEPEIDGYQDAVMRTGWACGYSLAKQWSGVEHHRLGRTDVALQRFREAEQWVSERDEMSWAPSLYLCWGRVLAEEGRLEEAETRFARSLDLSRSQRSKYWELRAATSMARLMNNDRRREVAHQLLQPTVDWFTEGLDTRYLVEAKALLWDLSDR